MSASPTLIIVDDDTEFLDLCQAFLARTVDYECVGTATDGRAGVLLWRELRPDLVLMDLNMPIMPGVEAIRIIHEEDPQTRVVALTSMADRDHVNAALLAGASGYIMKGCAPEEFLQSLDDASRGAMPLGEAARQALVGLLRTDQRDPILPSNIEITPREQETMRFLARGLPTRQIAKQMGLSEGSVKQYLHHLYVKFGVSSRMELLIEASSRGLITPM